MPPCILVNKDFHNNNRLLGSCSRKAGLDSVTYTHTIK